MVCGKIVMNCTHNNINNDGDSGKGSGDGSKDSGDGSKGSDDGGTDSLIQPLELQTLVLVQNQNLNLVHLNQCLDTVCQCT